jgi:IS30 family transposase
MRKTPVNIAQGRLIDALIKQAHKLTRELYKSLTWDRG